MKPSNHICSDHLDKKCRCKICGETHHYFIDDDDGTFAASGKVAHAICIRCGYEERYYSDSGTVIDGGWFGKHATKEQIAEQCRRWGHRWVNGCCELCGAIDKIYD